MSVIDIVILVLVGLSALAGLSSGVIRCIFSLLGLIAGIAFASRNYERFAGEWFPLTHSKALSEAVWFCLLAIAVMLVAGLLGWLVRGAVDLVGLGWLDKLAGLAFGLLRGAVLVTLCVMMLAAFYPDTGWLDDARLPRYFLSTARLTANVTPAELKARILDGLRVLERETPKLLHP